MATLTRPAETTGAITLATIGSATTALGAVKLRTHFYLVDFTILVFVEGSKCLGGILQFIGTQCAVFVRVNRLHHRVWRAKSTTTAKSTAITRAALTWDTGSSTFTAASTLSGAGRSTALATAKLFTEKCLNLFARGALILIELAITVLIELLDHGFPDVLATATSTFTAASTLSGTASALSWAFLSL